MFPASMADLSDSIEERAQAPKSTSVDGQTVTEHSLDEQIKADRYLRGDAGARQQNFGIRYGRFRHQGTS
jgi:hypothetical protein